MNQQTVREGRAIFTLVIRRKKERKELHIHSHSLLLRAGNWQTAVGWHHLQCWLQAQASSFSWLSHALCWKSIETQLFDYTQVWLRAVFYHYRAISCWRSSVRLYSAPFLCSPGCIKCEIGFQITQCQENSSRMSCSVLLQRAQMLSSTRSQ